MAASAAGMVVQLRDVVGHKPPPLVGASTTMLGSKIFLFGGYIPFSGRVMSDLYILDVELCKWEKLLPPLNPTEPKGRCFHTADIWNNHLVVFGGLTAFNASTHLQSERLQDLGDVRLFDLASHCWLPVTSNKSAATIPPPARHNHISCITGNHLVIFGGVDAWGEPLSDATMLFSMSIMRFAQLQDGEHSLQHCLQTWKIVSLLIPCHILRPFPRILPSKFPFSILLGLPVSIHSRSPPMAKSYCPPPRSLPSSRQPTAVYRPCGTILGTKLVVAGNSAPCPGFSPVFTVWTQDLSSNSWTRIDTGDIMKGGLWGNGLLWNPRNKLIVLGIKQAPSSHNSDAARRSLFAAHWDTMVFIDLEALGIYQAPARPLDLAHQQRALAILAEGQHVDFAFGCEDGREIGCAKMLVAGRWPWLNEKLELVRVQSTAELKSGSHITVAVSSSKCTVGASFPVVQALVQYLYSLSLSTSLQRAPAVLSHLLLIATEFRMSYLQALVKHAMHLALSEATAAGVYEVAALCGCRGLQIRAFSIHSRRWLKTGRARSHSEGAQTQRPRKQIVSSQSESSMDDLASRFLHNAAIPDGEPKLTGSNPGTKVRRLPSPRINTTTTVPPLPTPLSPLLSTKFVTEPIAKGLKTEHSPLRPNTPPIERVGRPAIIRQTTAPAMVGAGLQSRSQSAGPGSRIPRAPSRQSTKRETTQVPAPRSASSTPTPRLPKAPNGNTKRLTSTSPPLKSTETPKLQSSRSAQNLGKGKEVAGPRLPTYRRRNTVSQSKIH
ncbi:hypothetical protein MIND_00594900 [Mycena indigotica]|uniref:Galactose oxidase n=1 Tax=Mycena indigotica TaxID=2126181 RepID=A0A8H6STI0_9AGAR|nr:uncharacterized protein MIND_00594900 [Mycena indigotica]KAF7303655.1 hypothetical protein MIND_00594900 [Mycena indigotica]